MHERPSEGKSTVQRILLLAASLAVGVGVWFMLGESESVTAAEAEADGSAQTVLATVNGNAITEQDVLDSVAGELLKLKRQRHDLIAQAVDNKVREMLMEAEAKKRGITTDELMKAEVDDKISEVPQEQVDAFYEERKNQIRRPKEQVEDQIRRYLRFEAWDAKLHDGAKIEVMTEPFRVQVAADGPRKGPESAPITIVEFSDFECPFCQRVNPSIEKVREKYGDKVQVVFRQFPLAIHQNARKAGEASLCAHDQGKFWEMHDALFENQKNLGVDGLKTIAASIDDLDGEQFAQCLDSGKYAEQVERDFQAGAEAGVSGTPAFFINGRFLSGAQPFESFAEIIDEELENAS